jgi:hypothetical protein
MNKENATDILNLFNNTSPTAVSVPVWILDVDNAHIYFFFFFCRILLTTQVRQAPHIIRIWQARILNPILSWILTLGDSFFRWKWFVDVNSEIL